MKPSKRRVLFVGEAVTLSHVARPVVLARALDRERYDVTLACDPRYGSLLQDLPFPLIPLKSAVPQDRLLEALNGRQPLFDVGTLDAYVQEDLRLIKEHTPDIVVGDMRQSLAISGKLAGVTYLNIINAQWSPYSSAELELPDNPLAPFLGEALAQFAQRMAAPLGFAPHTIPLNVVSLKYGLPATGLDIKQAFSLGDYVAYPDIPEILPTSGLPATHSYLGPILWSPKVPLPGWWQSVPEDRSIVYVNLGSSGQHDLLSVVLEALAPLPISVMAATAGKTHVSTAPANCHLTDFLPGDEAGARAQLVICNGGNMSGQQALAAGAPILGVVSNVDQMAFARAVSRTGAGEVLREREVNAPVLRRVVWRMLAEQKYRDAARRLASRYAETNSASRFRDLIDRIFNVPADGHLRQ
ncbi:MAG: nucleotide disphospho-sugar-binding domain-containing protein [Acidobacteriota bacterium]